jgi:hypothetical protein
MGGKLAAPPLKFKRRYSRPAYILFDLKRAKFRLMKG